MKCPRVVKGIPAMLFHGVPVRDHFDDQRILAKPFVQAGLEFIQDGHRRTNAFLGNFFVFRKRDLFTDFMDFTDFFTEKSLLIMIAD